MGRADFSCPAAGVSQGDGGRKHVPRGTFDGFPWTAGKAVELGFAAPFPTMSELLQDHQR